MSTGIMNRVHIVIDNSVVPSEDKKIQEHVLLVVSFPFLQFIGRMQIAHTTGKLYSASGGREIFETLAS